MAQWHSGKALDLRSVGPGFNSHQESRTKLPNILEQIVHTDVPLSPSSITWYWSKDSDGSSAGKVTSGLAESNDSLSPGG